MFFLFKKYRFLCLFIILISFCLVKAIDAQFGYLGHVGLILVVLIVSNLFIIGHKENLLISYISAIVVLLVVLQMLGLHYDSLLVDSLKLSMVIGLLVFMTYTCFYYTLQDKTISITTLFGSICTYLFIGLLFAYIYLLVALLSQNAFSGLERGNEARSIYYSFITLTTVGFGDIYPLKPIAQAISWMESFCGQLYLAVVIGQMIGRYVAELQKRK